jgi:hypothetical protein
METRQRLGCVPDSLQVLLPRLFCRAFIERALPVPQFDGDGEHAVAGLVVIAGALSRAALTRSLRSPRQSNLFATTNRSRPRCVEFVT